MKESEKEDIFLIALIFFRTAVSVQLSSSFITSILILSIVGGKLLSHHGQFLQASIQITIFSYFIRFRISIMSFNRLL